MAPPLALYPSQRLQQEALHGAFKDSICAYAVASPFRSLVFLKKNATKPMFSTAAEKQALFWTFSAKRPKYLRFFGETAEFLLFGRKIAQFSAKLFMAAEK
ncbi:MAG: hypothetical protein KBS89_06985 [Bacteroidales bacterium]|nr:hypothetical protein [Candidatus Egerieousia equi]